MADIKTSAECDTMTAQQAHETVFMNHTVQGEEHGGYQDTKQGEKCALGV